ncbi:MAG: DUF3795 domain-containing protein [Thermodesulfobacteriota bacterium]
MVDDRLLAPCGLYCGVCGVLIATRDDNRKFKEKLAGVYGVTADQVDCQGCRSDHPWLFCRSCTIRTCVDEKGYLGCHQCGDWPCGQIENFPVEVGRRVIRRTIPRWRELGTEAFVVEEEKRYQCPHCGYGLFRGAKRCRRGQTEVDLD